MEQKRQDPPWVALGVDGWALYLTGARHWGVWSLDLRGDDY